MAKTSLALREANAIVRARTRYQGRRHHSRRKFELPMAVVAGFAPITYYTFKAWRTQGVKQLLAHWPTDFSAIARRMELGHLGLR